MKFSDLLMALRFLGVEEADGDPTLLMEIVVSRGKVTVTTCALDDNGHRFAANNEIALNTKTYELEYDL